eukprot:1400817-Prorocentrum_lima.AAC.1
MKLVSRGWINKSCILVAIVLLMFGAAVVGLITRVTLSVDASTNLAYVGTPRSSSIIARKP